MATMVRKALLYWNTIRHLRTAQIVGRLKQSVARTALHRGALPPRRRPTFALIEGVSKTRSMTSENEFRFFNRTLRLDSAKSWNDPATDKLVLYNLHYFDDLNAADALSRSGWHEDLVSRWINDNPPGYGNGWEPYAVSLRIVNWIKWSSGRDTTPAFDESLALQARWLSARVEYHILGNHLIANAKALIFAALYFEGIEPARWMHQGLDLFNREMDEQILDDGGHFERSPMYQATILEDILDLINAGNAVPGAVDSSTRSTWTTNAGRMYAWLVAMSHTDGQISFFNDAAFAIAPVAAELLSYAGRLGVGMPQDAATLSQSGFRRAHNSRAVLIADVGSVGPSYQPGHAHAGTLSFELSIGEHRVFVNSGTSTYQPGNQRAFERSTAAHNTIEVDGANSSEVWGSFRVARRASTQRVNDGPMDDLRVIEGCHDGYMRLPGKVRHCRTWNLADTGLRVADRLSGSFQRAVARFYLHPSITPLDGQRLQLPDGLVSTWSIGGGRHQVVEAKWHPEFGLSEPTHCIEIVLDGNTLTFDVAW